MVDQVTINRRVYEPLVNAANSSLFRCRMGRSDALIAVSAFGAIGGGTISLYRVEPGLTVNDNNRVLIDSWTAEFSEVAVPASNGDFYFVLTGATAESIIGVIDRSRGTGL